MTGFDLLKLLFWVLGVTLGRASQKRHCTMHTMQVEKCAESEMSRSAVSMVLFLSVWKITVASWIHIPTICWHPHIRRSLSHTVCPHPHPPCHQPSSYNCNPPPNIQAWDWVFRDLVTNLQNILDAFWRKPGSIEARYWLFFRPSLTNVRCCSDIWDLLYMSQLSAPVWVSS